MSPTFTKIGIQIQQKLKSRSHTPVQKNVLTMETEGDIRVLLETVLCRQHDNPTAVKDALLTLASMCTDHDKSVQEMIRKAGAISLVYKIGVGCNHDEDVMNAALYALGCFVDKCDSNQRELTHPQVFHRMSNLLSAGSNRKVLKTVSFFLLCLISNNVHAQTLARTANCLKQVMDLYKIHSPTLHDWPKDKQNLWNTLSVILGVCCNDPQNDDNQRLCSTIFPHSFQMLDLHGSNPEVVIRIMTLLGHIVAHNVYNQDRLVKCGGIQSLCSILHRAVNRLNQGPHYLNIALSVINVLEFVISENVAHAEKCGEHDLVMLLLKLLQNERLSVGNQLQIVVTIIHLVENSLRNQRALIESKGIRILNDILSNSRETTLTKAVQYVFEKCITVENLNILEKVDEVKNKEIAMTQSEDTQNKIMDNRPVKLASGKDKPEKNTKVACDATPVLRKDPPQSSGKPCDVPEKLASRSGDEKFTPKQTDERRITRNSEEINFPLDKEDQLAQANNNSMEISVAHETPPKMKVLLKLVKNLKVCGKDGKRIMLLAPISENTRQDTKLTQEIHAKKRTNDVMNHELPKETPACTMKENVHPTSSEDSSTVDVIEGHVENEAEESNRENETVLEDEDDEEKLVEVVAPSVCSSSRSKFERELLRETQKRLTASSISKVTHWLDTAVTSDVEEIHDGSNNDYNLSYPPSKATKPGRDDTQMKSITRKAASRSMHMEVDSRGDAPDTKGCRLPTQQRHNTDSVTKKSMDLKHQTCSYSTADSKASSKIRTQNFTKRRLSDDYHKYAESITSVSRGPRVQFSKEEEANLVKGVNRHGRSWTLILQSYKFHSKRNATDLKDKYRQMLKRCAGNFTESVASSKHRPRKAYSIQEEVNLLKGVERMGKFWTQILNTYNFHPGRTAVDLKDKYKQMMKNGLL